MPIDASIYQNLRPIEMPDMLASAEKAANLSSLAMQQKRMGKQMEQEDQDAKYQAHLRKASMYGNALEGLSGLTEQERAAAYPKVRGDLIASGVLKPEDTPEQYDPGLYRQNLFKFRETKESLDQQLLKSQIKKNYAEATKDMKPALDPVARQMQIAEYKEALKRQAAADEMKRYSNVGGWKLSEGATPTPDDAKKFKAGIASARSLLDNLNEYQKLISEKGAELYGKDAQRLESLARDIQLSAKNEDLYGLGVLTGPDLMLLEELIKAPTGLGDALNPMAGSKAANKAQQFRDMLNTRINAKAKTYGFEPQAEWTALAAGQKQAGQKGGGWSGNSAYADAPQIKPGTVEDGFVYMGGDPSDQRNWKKEK